jgi:hypothetical protein
MSDITTKTGLLDSIRSARATLEGALARFDEEALVTAAVSDEWTPKDTMAHIVYWEQSFLRWVEAGRRGEKPERPEFGVPWDDLDRLNREAVAPSRARSLDEVRAEFAASHRAILDAVAAMEEDEIFTVGRYAWTGKYPLLPYLRSNTDEHYAEHAAGLEAWLHAHGG